MTNYNRTEACVDWVELVVYPARHTNWQTVQKAIFQATGKAVDVRLIDRGHMFNKYAHDEGDKWVKYSPAFKFSLQDTARFIDVERVITQIKGVLKCQVTTTVTAIEVAFDIYGAGAEVAAAMYQGLKNPVSNNQRVYRRGKKRGGDFVKAAAKQTTAALVNYLQAGWTIGIGNETDDIYQRIYFKTTDHNGGVNKIQVEPRARIEIRLQGEELPFGTPEQLQKYKFTELSRHFLFRNSQGADKELNGLAGDAIQRLSRSWPTVGKSTKPTKKKSADFRHCQQGEQQESGNAETSASPNSEREQRQLDVRASGAHESGSLITCGLSQGERTYKRSRAFKRKRADSIAIDNHVAEPDALRLSRLNDDDRAVETLTPEMLRISRQMEIPDDEAAGVKLESHSSIRTGTLLK